MPVYTSDQIANLMLRMSILMKRHVLGVPKVTNDVVSRSAKLMNTLVFAQELGISPNEPLPPILAAEASFLLEAACDASGLTTAEALAPLAEWEEYERERLRSPDYVCECHYCYLGVSSEEPVTQKARLRLIKGGLDAPVSPMSLMFNANKPKGPFSEN